MKKVFNIALALLLFTSCSDFLEPKSQTEYVPRDINSLNEMLLGAAYLKAKGSGATFSYNEIFSDDVACTVEKGNHIMNASKYTNMKPYFAWHPEMFTLAITNGNDSKVWEHTFTRIMGCNAALDYIQTVTGTQQEKDYVKGQALALRAFYYFNLVNLFGEPYYYNKQALGVPLKLSSNMEIDFPKRNTVEEVYMQIVADLTEAEICYSQLPVSKQFLHDGRVTLPMIQLLMARTALFMNDYDKCATYSKKLINDWGLKLLDLNSFTTTPAQPYYEFTDPDNPEAIWRFGDAFDFAQFMSEFIYPLPNSTTQTRRLFNASPSLVNSYVNDDLRLKNYIIKESTTINNYIPIGKTPVSTTYALVSTKFGKALRLSEAYLMLAESYYFLDKQTNTVEVLEELRAKRFPAGSGNVYQVPEASKTGVTLLDFIKEERRRELCFEGLRWFDQRRWGMDSFSRDWKEEGEVIATFTMEKNDPAFTLPIPQDAIKLNPNLTQNKLSTPKY